MARILWQKSKIAKNGKCFNYHIKAINGYLLTVSDLNPFIYQYFDSNDNPVFVANLSSNDFNHKIFNNLIDAKKHIKKYIDSIYAYKHRIEV